jgi:zinc protease
MKKLLYAALSTMLIVSCAKQEKTNKKFMTQNLTDANGYDYQVVDGDPMGVKIYTLKNGLKVYLSENNAEPRIQTLVSVKAGSTYDPKETTGLAHYLEHMMFKGTSKIGSSNWDAEKVQIEEISRLFEEHKGEIDPEKKTAIYAKIDSTSNAASKNAIANEFTKLLSTLGVKGTNAYTSNEETVYMNDIPANEVGKWIKLERERFGELTLRLFHTELETVYEEFNRGQDNDGRKAYEALNDLLFPTHPYGQQTTIGEAEHLKNPSLVNINNYFNNYYRSNNMAIILSGDFNSEEVIKMIDAEWGDMEPNNDLKHPLFVKEEPISSPKKIEVYGPSGEYLQMAYRLGGIGSEDELLATLFQNLLSNGAAGIMDLNLVQKQKVLQASAYSRFLKEYGMFAFYGKSREGQELSEVQDLLLAEIEKIKRGEFEQSQLEAVINNLRVDEIRKSEENRRAFIISQAFTHEMDWASRVEFNDKIADISKQQVIDFAKKTFNNNYVVVYKRTGVDSNIVKVDKPEITPITIDRESQSAFFTEFNGVKSPSLKPLFVDYKKAINTSDIKEGLQMYYIENKQNELFEMSFIVDMGRNHNVKVPIAFDYLEYLGTQTMSPEDVKTAFYNLGVDFSTYTSSDQSYISLSGLESSMEKGLALIEDLIHNAKANDETYKTFVEGVIKKRTDSKLSMDAIKWSGMYNHAVYGSDSPFMNNLSNEELLNIDPNELVEIIGQIFNYEHSVFYYGGKTQENSKNLILASHSIPEQLTELPKEKEYEFKSTDNNVYFVDYDMVQADIMILAKGDVYDPKITPMARLFNEFYGGGLSSIIFQEIRESKGLAYSAFASYTAPSKKENPHYLRAFVGTQADKLEESLFEMINILNNMPEAEKQFELAKQGIVSKIESERLIKTRVFWDYLDAKDRGLDYDIRKDVYETVKNATLADMVSFFNDYIKSDKYTIAVMGNKKDIDLKVLAKYGEVVELDSDKLFPY